MSVIEKETKGICTCFDTGKHYGPCEDPVALMCTRVENPQNTVVGRRPASGVVIGRCAALKIKT